MNELIEVCAGKSYKVLMTPAVHKHFGKADPKARARCQKWMKFFADDGHEFLDAEKLKHEGKFGTGHKNGNKVSIWAFKAWQLRVYGGVVSDGVFVATEIDTKKKQNAADQDLLESAARKLADYL